MLPSQLVATWTALATVVSAVPNILFILTDDQDVTMGSMDYMPKLKQYIIDRGINYKSHYATVSICCPSRVSMWTGKAAHNTNVTDLTGAYGGYNRFVEYGWNDDWLPVWLEDAGINMYYSGKLMNSHTRFNYDNPYPRGFAGTRFYVAPWTYKYLTPAVQKNKDPPVIMEGAYSNDVITNVTLELIDEAVDSGKPWVVVAAPIGPHSSQDGDEDDNEGSNDGGSGPPIPATRHENLFQDAQVPRGPNFNLQSGASWVAGLREMPQDQIEWGDLFHRRRLQTLQSIDDMIEEFVNKLEARGVLDNTYIMYTTDNGFHIGQHRLLPGKGCGYESDILVPMAITGPGVPQGAVVENVATTHLDIAPTIMQLMGVSLDHQLDGIPIPLTQDDLDSDDVRIEHAGIEFWGRPNQAGGEFKYQYLYRLFNTYKGVRVTSNDYGFYYQVWCSNEHELYDMKADPYQTTNLYNSTDTELMGRPVQQVINRLDALILVLKTCKEETCVYPWQALQPNSDVNTLQDAMSEDYDDFYDSQVKVSYNECKRGYLKDSEGPMFEDSGLVYSPNGETSSMSENPSPTENDEAPTESSDDDDDSGAKDSLLSKTEYGIAGSVLAFFMFVFGF